MKKLFVIAIFVLAAKHSCGQSRMIEAHISNPQPRLNEFASIIIEPRGFADTILSSLSTIDQLLLYGNYNSEFSLASVKTDKKGIYKIGNLEYTLNQTKYYTPKLSYEVIDSLPNTDKGIWIRKYIVNDSCFWIMIEQRTPYEKKNDTNKSFSVTMDEFAQRIHCEPVGFDNIFYCSNGPGSAMIKQIWIDGIEKLFIESHSYHCFKITDKNAKIVISEKDFKNLHCDYDFQDIVIK